MGEKKKKKGKERRKKKRERKRKMGKKKTVIAGSLQTPLTAKPYYVSVCWILSRCR